MYPSKILLFGEYSILLNSYALAMPYGKFQGDWAFMNDVVGYNPLEAHDSNRNLRVFLKHFKLIEKNQSLNYHLDITRFDKDIENGIYFKSNIPIGYGFGSSGALVAAIFDRYVNDQIQSRDDFRLKKSLAFLESFYHCTSSGIDPLVCYLNSPVLVKSNNEFEKLDLSIDKVLQKNGLFLVDSGQKGKTSELVSYFNQKCNSDIDYLNSIKNRYIPLNNECIKEIIGQNDSKHFFSLIHELSSLQLLLFEKMIPRNFVPLMNYGIENDLFFLKLCGSGGGFFLGFSKNLVKTKEYFDKEGHEILIFQPVARQIVGV